MSLLMAGGWNQMIFKVLSNPNHAMILCYAMIMARSWEGM